MRKKFQRKESQHKYVKNETEAMFKESQHKYVKNDIETLE